MIDPMIASRAPQPAGRKSAPSSSTTFSWRSRRSRCSRCPLSWAVRQRRLSNPRVVGASLTDPEFSRVPQAARCTRRQRSGSGADSTPSRAVFSSRCSVAVSTWPTRTRSSCPHHALIMPSSRTPPVVLTSHARTILLGHRMRRRTCAHTQTDNNEIRGALA